MVWTYIKDMPSILFWILLPIHVAGNLYIVFRFILLGKGKIILKSKWDAFKGIPKAWRNRKVIQANRVASISEIWRILDKSIMPVRLFKLRR